MISLFRRGEKTSDNETDSALTSEDAGDEAKSAKGYTAAKGRPTPKRSLAQRRQPATAPQSKKEARQRLKEKNRAERQAQHEGMRRGDDKYLYPRDQGPVRRYVRDIVDSRRNAGSLFFAGTLLVFVGSLQFMPSQIRFFTSTIWIGLILLFLVDAVFLTLRIRTLVKERFGKDSGRMLGHCFYGVMRSVVFRRLRTPAPAVKVGDPINAGQQSGKAQSR